MQGYVWVILSHKASLRVKAFSSVDDHSVFRAADGKSGSWSLCNTLLHPVTFDFTAVHVNMQILFQRNDFSPADFKLFAL